MTSSSTYLFGVQETVADGVIEAFERCGIRPSALETEHMISAKRSCNLVFVDFINAGVNLWAVDLQTQLLTQGLATYSLPQETVLMLDVYVSTTVDGVTTDRIIFPISRTDYASYPNKQTQSPPNVFWYDRLTAPTVTLWPTPDGNGPYTLKYYRMRQIQDASPTMGQTFDMPYRYMNAFMAKLAAALSWKWAPDRTVKLEQQAKMVWDAAFAADRENVPIYIRPDMSSFFR